MNRPFRRTSELLPRLLLLLGILPCLAAAAAAQIPTYSVRPIASFSVTTSFRGASEAGHVVGYQVVTGQIVPFLATAAAGLSYLPLPAGYVSGFAQDVNSRGIVVGAVARNGFPFDLGEPAIWLPQPGGSYSVVIPQQFASMPGGPRGPLPINGGMAVAINDNDVIVGWSRYQGFQGGPSTRFFVSGAPVDLKAAGFQATVTALSDSTDLIVGDDLLMDLNTGVVTQLGRPNIPVGVNYTLVDAYAVNDAGQTIAAVRRATSLPDAWLSFRHDPVGGWALHDPNQLPYVYVGFYDNNDRGDVVAPGGVWFAAEQTLLPGFDGLLEPASAHWDTSLGFLTDSRHVYTTAVDTNTGQHWIVELEPKVCQPDLGFQGPGSAQATVCGTGLGPQQRSDYRVGQAPPGAVGFVAVSLPGSPDLPWLGGTLVSFNGLIVVPVQTDATGSLSFSLTGSAGQPLDTIFQSAFLDAAVPTGVTITNAIRARFGL